MEILLVRHGENVLPARQKALMRTTLTESGLTSNGATQALALAQDLKALRRTRSSVLLTSPSRRCVETAEHVGKALGLEPEVVHHIDDRGVGGRTFSTLAEYREWQLAAWVNATESTDGSESLSALRRRVSRWLQQLLSLKVDRAVVITHGSVIEQVTSILLGTTPRKMAKAFILCSHGRYHHWSVSNSGQATLVRANVGPGAAQAANAGDAYQSISRRIGAGQDQSIFVVDKYYVR